MNLKEVVGNNQGSCLEIDEARQEIQARCFWDPCCNTREQEQERGTLACSWRKEGAGSLDGRRVRVHGWVGGPAGGKVWVVSLPPWLCRVQGSWAVLTPAPKTSKMAVCAIIAAAAHSCSYFWSLLVSLCLLLQERSVQVQSLHRVPRSSLSHFKPC